MSDPRETVLASWTAPDAEGWRRLDPRMSIVTGARVVGSAALPAIPALLGLAGRLGYWTVLALAGVLVVAGAFGLAHWLTTGYRVTDRRFELRSGVLRRNLQNAPLDRVRTIDLTAPLLHRILGVTKVAIGTGVDLHRVELGAVTHGEAARLRAELLPDGAPPYEPATTAAPTAAGPTAAIADVGVPPTPDAAAPTATPRATEEVLALLDWRWLRFAPLSLARLAVVAGAFTALSQVLPDLHIDENHAASSFWGWVQEQAVALIVVLGVVGIVVAWLAIAVIGYALQWGGLRLSRQQRGERPAIHLQAGLLSTRAVTIEERRIRGVVLTEPLLLRWAGGAEVSTWATGVKDGVAQVLPPCPRPVAVEVAARVLGLADDAPLAVPLTRHGRVARRRTHLRGQWPALALLAATAVLALVPDAGPAWQATLTLAPIAALIGAGCAESCYRHLGHAVVPGPRGGHVVAGSGILTRRRTVLEADGVIGWVVRQSFFQRRAGVATLVATTAAGPEQAAIRDVPLGEAHAVIGAVSPRLVAAFAAPQTTAASARTSAMSSS
ncbi:PH domain-containing protein [Nocardioides fonticola]|uniref:PH domain-containing protein n=1 Tax=Nocardioides fonticola TaxID=450363 RepID=A0ABP7XHF6_9ACTN